MSGGVAETGDLSAAVVFDPLFYFGGSVTEVPEDEDGARRERWHAGCLRNWVSWGRKRSSVPWLGCGRSKGSVAVAVRAV